MVDALVLSKPDDALTLSTLNPLWEEDIQNGKLMLMFKVLSHDAATGELIVEAGSGCYVDEAYDWHVPPAPLTLQLNGCSFVTTVPADISIWPASMNKAILVTGLSVNGHFSPDATAIPGADLDGTLARADAEGLAGMLGDFEIALVDFFDGAGVDLDVDLDGDGEMDGWGMAGQLAAQALSN